MSGRTVVAVEVVIGAEVVVGVEEGTEETDDRTAQKLAIIMHPTTVSFGLLKTSKLTLKR